MLPILLTASVDTRGMRGAKFDAKERERMYVDTLNFYIDDFGRRGEPLDIVFAENSGWPMESVLRQLHHREGVNVEYIALNADDFPTERGKSWNECLLLDQATLRSESVQRAGRFFKLTGRFPIVNLGELLKEVNRGGVSSGISTAIAATTGSTTSCTCPSTDMPVRAAIG